MVYKVEKVYICGMKKGKRVVRKTDGTISFLCHIGQFILFIWMNSKGKKKYLIESFEKIKEL